MISRKRSLEECGDAAEYEPADEEKANMKSLREFGEAIQWGADAIRVMENREIGARRS
ncbi:hypothetical protein [Cohnella fermenti]|uniref:hypothetical protein n=1 Tax=Cohnella fermenti TaxID=2565925 RepID=UPI001454BF2F|nr:hypothetical protein [Cohnella fermenti]